MTIDFVVATPFDAVEFNDVYRNTTGSAGYKACNNIFNRVVLNEWYRANPFPDLATHWECLDGARHWRFHLNQAARWQDGEPLTSHDVAYTHSHALEKGYSGGRFLTDVVEIVEVDRHTVDYHLSEPDSTFTIMLGNFIFTHILPAHLFEGTDWATNPHTLDPVGSGPFRLAEWAPGEHIILEAVKDHWGPQPGVDRIIMKIEPNRDECVRMVGCGEAHMVPQDTLTYDRIHLLDNPSAPVDVHARQGPGMALLDFNHRHEKWQNVTARRAIAQAIDRSAFEPMADRERDVSQPWHHYALGSIDWALNHDATAPQYDVVQAEKLLDEAGLGADENGSRGSLRLFHMDMFHAHAPICAAIAKQLEAVGFTITVEALSSPDWAERVIKNSDFDLICVGGSMAPEMSITRPKYSSDGRRNIAGHKNKEADACYTAAKSALTQAERAVHYKKLQEIWARDVEWVPLFWYGIYYPRSAKFFGWADQLDFSVPWWHWGRIRPV